MTMFKHIEVGANQNESATDQMHALCTNGREHAAASHDFLTTTHSRLAEAVAYTLTLEGVGRWEARMHGRAAVRPLLYIARMELDIAKAWPNQDLKWREHFVQAMAEAEARKRSRHALKV